MQNELKIAQRAIFFCIIESLIFYCQISTNHLTNRRSGRAFVKSVVFQKSTLRSMHRCCVSYKNHKTERLIFFLLVLLSSSSADLFSPSNSRIMSFSLIPARAAGELGTIATESGR